jgi:peptidoglycan/xylan/chitin deacetylase (PgdA/CDA1 family)
MYHSIFAGADTSWRTYTVDPGLFRDHLSYLKDTGYTGITAGDLAQALADSRPLPPRPVVLTFDDGHGDFASDALPALAQHGMTATVFVTTGFTGGRSPWKHRDGEPGRPMLSWEEVRAIGRTDVEIGAHGVTHRKLDSLRRMEAAAEIRDSKQTIEQRTGVAVGSFC